MRGDAARWRRQAAGRAVLKGSWRSDLAELSAGSAEWCFDGYGIEKSSVSREFDAGQRGTTENAGREKN